MRTLSLGSSRSRALSLAPNLKISAPARSGPPPSPRLRGALGSGRGAGAGQLQPGAARPAWRWGVLLAHRSIVAAAFSASSSWPRTRARPSFQNSGRRDPARRWRPAPRDCASRRLQELDVAGHERLALREVAAVDGQREQLAVGVGVHVAGRADEVRHVGPRAVALGDLDRVAEQLGLGGLPQVADPLHRQLALLAAGRVDGGLELVHRRLAEHGGDRALDVLGQQAQARGGRLGGVEQTPEHERLAEHRRGLGQRERRVLLERAARSGQRRVQAVAQLVGQREHVAAARGVVEHQVRVRGGDGVRAEGAAALALAHGRVDVAPVEELLRGLAERGRVGERRRHELGRLVPADLHLLAADRGHAVVVGQAVEPQQAAPSAGTSGEGRSWPSPRRRAPARTRRWPRWRGCGWPATTGSCADGPRPPCPAAAC